MIDRPQRIAINHHRHRQHNIHNSLHQHNNTPITVPILPLPPRHWHIPCGRTSYVPVWIRPSMPRRGMGTIHSSWRNYYSPNIVIMTVPRPMNQSQIRTTHNPCSMRWMYNSRRVKRRPHDYLPSYHPISWRITSRYGIPHTKHWIWSQTTTTWP